MEAHHLRVIERLTEKFKDDYGQALVLFMQESEWNWRAGRAPLQDW